MNVIDEIRAIDENFKRIKLKGLTVHRSSMRVDFDFICDKSASDDALKDIEKILRSRLPSGFSLGNLAVTKIVADPELVAKSIVEYVDSRYKAVSHSILEKDVEVRYVDGKCEYVVNAYEDVCRYFEENSLLIDVNEYLATVYCDVFEGKMKNVGKPHINTDILKTKANASDYESISVRTIDVADPVKIWGDEIEPRAVYMADSNLVSGDITFAGTVTAVTQKETKNGKTMYVVEFSDTTGKMSGKIFKTIEKEKKMEKVLVGTQILTRGDLALFNGNLSYVIRDLSYCVFPSDFVPKERVGRVAPSEYSLIFPEKVEEVSQGNLFAIEKDVEPCLIGKKFVVVDIETTGLSYLSGDKITEIGAVRIVDGKIIDKFQTLINPEQKISAQITDLTGIDDAMVADAPLFDAVIPDFYKYCDGYVFVAHNIEFDYKFIKYMAQKSGYIFKNEGLDTLAYAKAALPRMKNYKLNTLCDYYDIHFLHHRAWSDAYATAQLLIKLAETKKSLI